MAKYAAITHRATLLGDMFGGTEEWSSSFFLGQTNGGDEGDAPTVAEAEAIATAFSTFFTTSSVKISSKFRFLGVKVSHVNTIGTSDAGLTQYHYLTTPAVGSNAGVSFPPQVALAVTLATLKARGKGSKGRMYIPGVSEGVADDGKLSMGTAVAVANVFKVFIDNVNASTAVPGVVVLNSAESPGIPGSPAEMNRVASIRVGTVYDTQRRRRNQLVEQYASAALA